MTVNRWHCHPDERLRNSGDNIDMHQMRVALLCNTFAIELGLPDDRRRVLEFVALNHDEPERIMGDWPGPLLAMFPWLRPVKWLLERLIFRRMGIKMPRLSRKEAAILHLADKLDGELWARRHGVTGAHDADKLMKQAEALGLGDMVRGMLG